MRAEIRVERCMQKASVNRTRKIAEVSLNYGPIPANSLMETQQEGWCGRGGRGGQQCGARGGKRGSYLQFDGECLGREADDVTEDWSGKK